MANKRKRKLTETERFKDLRAALAYEHDMDVNDLRFSSVYDAAKLAAGERGLRAVDHYFDVYFTLMRPYFHLAFILKDK